MYSGFLLPLWILLFLVLGPRRLGRHVGDFVQRSSLKDAEYGDYGQLD